MSMNSDLNSAPHCTLSQVGRVHSVSTLCTAARCRCALAQCAHTTCSVARFAVHCRCALPLRARLSRHSPTIKPYRDTIVPKGTLSRPESLSPSPNLSPIETPQGRVVTPNGQPCRDRENPIVTSFCFSH